MQPFLNDAWANKIQFITLPLEIVGFVLTFIEVLFPRFADKLEELADYLQEEFRKNLPKFRKRGSSDESQRRWIVFSTLHKKPNRSLLPRTPYLNGPQSVGHPPASPRDDLYSNLSPFEGRHCELHFSPGHRSRRERNRDG